MIKSLMKHGVELSDPDSVIRFLNVCSWESGTKDIAIDSYRDYLNMLGLKDVQLPHIRRDEKDPFIPLEEELDALISNARTKMSSLLRVLKESAVRPIEAWRLKWLDIDVANRCVTITPAKYSKPRRPKISEQTLNILCSLPRTGECVFSPSGNKEQFSDELEHFAINFCKMKRRVAGKLANPRISLISLRTFRYWKATTLYHQTKDILYVKEFLGHKNIANTLRYVHLANALAGNEDGYTCKLAKTVHEASDIIENGFEYVTEMDSVKLFRKRK